MILLPSTISRLPNNKEIDSVVDLIGYTGYVPYSIIIDFYALLVHRVLKSKCVDTSSPYTDLLEDAVAMIDESQSASLYTAVLAFKSITSKVNLRELEGIKHTNISVNIDLDNNQKNYSVDLNEIPELTLKLLGIDLIDEVNTLPLDDTILEILEFKNGIMPQSGNSQLLNAVISDHIRNYGQLSRIRKYKFADPRYSFNLARKRFFINTFKDVEVQFNEMILMIDRSMSTGGFQKYQHMVKGVLLSLLESFKPGINTIKVIEFTDSILNTYSITSKEELVAYIKKGVHPVTSFTDYKDGFVLLHKYRGQSVTLLTDGTADFLDELSKKIRWDIVSLEYNVALSALASNSGGQFIKL